MRSHFNKPVVDTWRELNGIACIDTTEATERQSICTSRSFGQMVKDLDALKESVVTFASGCAIKLRGQGSVTRAVTVFVTTNRFREDLPQYADSYTEQLSMPTADTLEIVSAAIRALKRIYREGYSYKKSGVILTDISRADCLQQDLFDEVRNRPQRMALMRAIDHINQSYGANTLCVGVGNSAASSWHNKCDHRSGNYLTDIKGILRVG